MSNYKKTTLAAALALAAAAPLAHAAGSFDAFVSAAAGMDSTDYSYFYNAYYYGSPSTSQTAFDNNVASFRATAEYTDPSNFGGQLDYVYTSHDLDNGWYDNQTHDIAGHVFYRGKDWLAGGLIQHRSFEVDGGEGGSSVKPKITLFGVEAQKQFGSNFSLYGQLGYQHLNYQNWDWKLKGWAGSVEGRYFINDNFLIKAGVNYGEAKDDASCCGNYWNWNDKFSGTAYELGAEYRFAGSPFSVFGSYSRLEQKYNFNETGAGGEWYHGSDKYTTDQFMVGVKLSVGKDSLRSRNNEGASLNPMNLMSHVISQY